MDFLAIASITVISTLCLYLIFVLIGVAGIAHNREVQGFEQKSNK